MLLFGAHDGPCDNEDEDDDSPCSLHMAAMRRRADKLRAALAEVRGADGRTALITATLADPDALWAVLTSGVKVAGPWETNDGRSCWRRQMGSVYPVASVVAIGCSANFQAFVFKNLATDAQLPLSRAAGMEWCDQKLRESGWLLATGGKP